MPINIQIRNRSFSSGFSKWRLSFSPCFISDDRSGRIVRCLRRVKMNRKRCELLLEASLLSYPSYQDINGCTQDGFCTSLPSNYSLLFRKRWSHNIPFHLVEKTSKKKQCTFLRNSICLKSNYYWRRLNRHSIFITWIIYFLLVSDLESTPASSLFLTVPAGLIRVFWRCHWKSLCIIRSTAL